MGELVYDGFLKIELIESEIKGKTVKREKLLMKNSVAGILKNELGLYCLVKQYRPVVGDYFYEMPAGICDKEGLSNIEILVEEIEEECEISKEGILDIRYVIDYFMAIGFSDAKLFIYEVDVKGTDSSLKYVEDTDVESIEWFELSEIDVLIKEGKIKDNKTILMYNYLIANLK